MPSLLCGQCDCLSVRQPLVLSQMMWCIQWAQQSGPLQVLVHRQQGLAQVLWSFEVLEVADKEPHCVRNLVIFLSAIHALSNCCRVVFPQNHLVNREDSEGSRNLSNKQRLQLTAWRIVNDAGRQCNRHSVVSSSLGSQHVHSRRFVGVHLLLSSRCHRLVIFALLAGLHLLRGLGLLPFLTTFFLWLASATLLPFLHHHLHCVSRNRSGTSSMRL
mmetsp:Transcript_8740/g.19522  ORF Transcript_8740/g.19522 Transcript_8740/m.19522 type:complete len:216 (+) Transcript_8740:374-1021(+)